MTFDSGARLNQNWQISLCETPEILREGNQQIYGVITQN
jgi:hypothetical protein